MLRQALHSWAPDLGVAHTGHARLRHVRATDSRAVPWARPRRHSRVYRVRVGDGARTIRGHPLGTSSVKLKLDENLGRRCIEILAADGHEVATVAAQSMTSASDNEVIDA